MVESESVEYREEALWKLKKGLTGSYWKKNWVYADGETLYQWQSTTKPVSGEAPKYSCLLGECKIEESSIRKFAFKITEKTGQESMVFAADDFDSYEAWLKLFFGSIAYNSSAYSSTEIEKSEEVNEEVASLYSDDFKQVASDRIADYFYQHDITKEPKDPGISAMDLCSLLHSLDASINTASTASVVLRELNMIGSDGASGGVIVSYSAFKRWWSLNSQYFGPSGITDRTGTSLLAESGGDACASSHSDLLAGLGLGGTALARSEFLFKARVPKQSAYAHVDRPVFDSVADWNAEYQEVREQASLTQNYHLDSRDEAAIGRVWTNYRVGGAAGGSAGQDLSDNKSSTSEAIPADLPVYSAEDATKACLALAAFHGAFAQVAAAGAELVVDEYCLPVLDRTVKAVGPHLGRAEEPALYEYQGLVLRIVAEPASTLDRAVVRPTPLEDLEASLRARQLSAVDEVNHKAAGLEQRGLGACLCAAECVYADYQMRLNWRALVAADSDEPQRRAKFQHFLRPCTLLTTLVDYAGFRVEVTCPAPLAEAFTLVHGFAEINTSRDEAASANGANDTVPEDANKTHRVFVDALPAYRSVLSQLAAELHLTVTKVPQRSVISSTLVENGSNNFATSPAHVHVLTSTLQAHHGTDDRLYVVNFSAVMPLDTPRDRSTDGETRYLRPEFLQHLRQISGSALPSGGVLLSSEGVGGELREIVEADAGALSAEVEACAYLYTVHIPRAARTLDSLRDMVPLDSFTLTTWLHDRGISCRHMGLLYQLCTTPCVRQVLLTECVARACKAILRNTLKRLARQDRAETLAAEQRGRSRGADYVEYLDQSHARRRVALLDLFNLVFGLCSGAPCEPSESFWGGALQTTVAQKFGSDMLNGTNTHSKVSALLHFPQLFLALQYHTYCRFRDLPYKHVFAKGDWDSSRGARVPGRPFAVDDLVVDFAPECDSLLLRAVREMPGEVGRTVGSAEAFLANGMFSEAARAFQLRLAVQSSISGSSTSLTLREEALLADTLYKIALSLFCGGQSNEASEVVRSQYLSRFSQCTAATARMLTLLMRSEFRCSRFDCVRVCFDAAQSIYSHLLGALHPVVAQHMCALADLYTGMPRNEGTRQARAMLVLARAVSCKALGEHHLCTVMYDCKLAALCARDNLHREATVLLSGALAVMDAHSAVTDHSQRGDVDDAGAHVLGREKIDCLHALTESLARCGELDLAIHSGFRCVELCVRLQRNSLLHVSCLLTLCDLFVQKSDMDSAFGLIHEAWTVLRDPSIAAVGRLRTKHVTGQVLADLACRILEFMVCSLPVQTRALFQSVAEEVLLQRDESAEGVAAWEKACAVVSTALWNGKPADYLVAVIQGIQKNETGDIAGSPQKENSRDGVVSFAAQAAVILKIVKNPQEFSQRLISF